MQRPWLVLAGAIALPGCGTDAENVSGCRALERARCSAAAACGFSDVDECQRFERDQCLHGFGVEDVGSVELDACIRDIEAAGACAAERGAMTPADACSPAISVAPPLAPVCDVIRNPERASSCAFLAPDAPPPDAPPPDAPPATDGGA